MNDSIDGAAPAAGILLLLAAIALALFGCGRDMVLLKHPDTAAVKECAPRGALRDFPWAEAREIRECVAAYEKAGYQRVN